MKYVDSQDTRARFNADLRDCDECGTYVNDGIELRSHAEDEYGPCFYCRTCIENAAAMLNASRARE